MKPVLQIRELITLNKHAWYIVYRPNVTIYLYIQVDKTVNFDIMVTRQKKSIMQIWNHYMRSKNKSTCSKKKMDYKRFWHQQNEFLKISSIIFLIILINDEKKNIDELLVADYNRSRFGFQCVLCWHFQIEFYLR